MAYPFDTLPHFPFPSALTTPVRAKFAILEIPIAGLLSLFRGLRASNPHAQGVGGRTRVAQPRTLWKKEREATLQGRDLTPYGNSFTHMIAANWKNGIAYMAFGACATYLGMWTMHGDGHWVSALWTLGIGLAGAGVLMRGGRSLGHPSRSLRDSAWNGRQEDSMDMECAPLVPARQERSDEAALLGHEMKNYLCTLKGNARLLRQRMPSNDQVIIDRIDRVVAKLESFTRGMAETHAATATGVLWHVRPADAAQACARTHFHKDVATFIWAKNDEAPTLLCDPDRLEQVFLNLYSNSLEAGARKVETSVVREKGKLTVRIEDDGRGCAEEDLTRIFEPFFTTKQGPARRGLGMFIVQSIVENHGGMVKVRTKNGGADGRTGLIFTLTFPQPPVSPVVNAVPAPLDLAGAPDEMAWLLPEPNLI
jgi:signal transduction histidine kinase